MGLRPATKRRTWRIALPLIVGLALVGCGRPAATTVPAPDAPRSPAPTTAAASSPSAAASSTASMHPTPLATVEPLPSDLPGDIAYAVRQRRSFGLRSDLAWVRQVAADPRARMDALDFLMLPEEDATASPPRPRTATRPARSSAMPAPTRTSSAACTSTSPATSSCRSGPLIRMGTGRGAQARRRPRTHRRPPGPLVREGAAGGAGEDRPGLAPQGRCRRRGRRRRHRAQHRANRDLEREPRRASADRGSLRQGAGHSTRDARRRL